jgi:hypothetical protein
VYSFTKGAEIADSVRMESRMMTDDVREWDKRLQEVDSVRRDATREVAA